MSYSFILLVLRGYVIFMGCFFVYHFFKVPGRREYTARVKASRRPVPEVGGLSQQPSKRENMNRMKQDPWDLYFEKLDKYAQLTDGSNPTHSFSGKDDCGCSTTNNWSNM